jgi:hypothetical protein
MRQAMIKQGLKMFAVLSQIHASGSGDSFNQTLGVGIPPRLPGMHSNYSTSCSSEIMGCDSEILNQLLIKQAAGC